MRGYPITVASMFPQISVTMRPRRIFLDAARAGQAASPTEHEQFSSYLLLVSGATGRRERLDQPISYRSLAKQQFATLSAGRSRHRLRLDWRYVPRPFAGPISRSVGSGERFAQNDRLQSQSQRQLFDRQHVGEFPGRQNARKNAAGIGLVVSRSKRRHAMANQRVVQHWPAVPICWHADRLTQLHVIYPSRVFPPYPLRSVWPRYGRAEKSPLTIGWRVRSLPGSVIKMPKTFLV